MKTDDDAFVRIDELLSSLKEKPSSALLYGLISFDSSPDREQGSKWFIRKEVKTSQYFSHLCVLYPLRDSYIAFSL